MNLGGPELHYRRAVEPVREQAQSVVLYDGACGFCGWCVALAARQDAGVFRFATLQGVEGRSLLKAHDASALERPDTIYVVDRDGNVFSRSAAVILVMQHLSLPWRWAAGLVGVLPKRVRDYMYDAVARNRYLFGACGLRTKR